MSLLKIINSLNHIDELLVVCALLNLRPENSDQSVILDHLKKAYDPKKIDRYPRLKNCLNRLREGLDRFYDQGGYLLTKRQNIFPGLWQDRNAPPVFFGRNGFNHDHLRPCIAIVGSRDATVRALTLTHELASKLAKHGWLVVSGGAEGVDLAAHKGALHESVGMSLAIIGNPVNFFGDERPERLRHFGMEKLSTLTPFHPSIFMSKHLFLERNRFVASIAEAIIVVQGKKGSGTLSTANFALKLAKAVYALPGNIDDPLSFVPNSLIYGKKAIALIDIDEFICSMSSDSHLPKEYFDESLDKDEDKLLEIIRKFEKPLSVDELIVYSGWQLLKLQALIVDLELKNYVRKRGSEIILTKRLTKNK